MARISILILAGAGLLSLSACKETKATASAKTIKQYESYCSSCHEVGAANAPRRGDPHQWDKRLKKGEERLLSSIKSGLVAMPPRGGCKDCTDEDFKALVQYMAQE